MNKYYLSLLIICIVLLKSPTGFAQVKPAVKPIQTVQEISISEILAQSKQSYQLDILRQNISVQEALSNQAVLPPNPNLNLSVEALPSLKGEGGEVNLLWSQPWAISGRLKKKETWIKKKMSLSQMTFDLKQRRLQRQLKQLFYRGLTWQRYLDETQKLIDLSGKFVSILHAQYIEGKVLLSEYNRARLLLENLRLQKQKSQLEWKQAKSQVSVLLNHSEPRFQRFKGELEIPLNQLLSLDSVKEPSIHPELSQAEEQFSERKSYLAFQEALAWPDLQWQLGARYTPIENNLGAISGFQWPLPLLNQNQGKIKAAGIQVKQKQLQKKWITLNFKNRWQQVKLRLDQARLNLKIYQTQILPLAESSLKINRAAYQSGKLSYLEVLDAQRSVRTSRQKYILEWGNYYQVLTELNYFYESGFQHKMLSQTLSF